MIDENNKYTKMQKRVYEQLASEWNTHNRDPVVGSFDKHNNHSDYEKYLFKDIPNSLEKDVLEFGCGPGRNLVKFTSKFKRIDGCDISEINLTKAAQWLYANNILKHTKLYIVDGISLGSIPTEDYDIIFSTICLQHICVYDIRLSILKDHFRVLRKNGYICAQMGFDTDGGSRFNQYHANNYDADGTNGSYNDVSITDVSQIKSDLEAIGFTNFEYDICTTGPGDTHTNWIFFRAQKI